MLPRMALQMNGTVGTMPDEAVRPGEEISQGVPLEHATGGWLDAKPLVPGNPKDPVAPSGPPCVDRAEVGLVPELSWISLELERVLVVVWDRHRPRPNEGAREMGDHPVVGWTGLRQHNEDSRIPSNDRKQVILEIVSIEEREAQTMLFPIYIYIYISAERSSTFFGHAIRKSTQAFAVRMTDGDLMAAE
jgi:hypothetical protein